MSVTAKEHQLATGNRRGPCADSATSGGSSGSGYTGGEWSARKL
jgi:hypothetical protein